MSTIIPTTPALGTGDPALAEKQLEILELLSSIGSHCLLGEWATACDLTRQLSAALAGEQTAPSSPVSYTVACRWANPGDEARQIERVHVDAPTRTIATLKAEAVVRELYSLDADVQIVTLVQLPGTVDDEG